MTPLRIRAEQPADSPHIRVVLKSAFPGGSEADLVDRLRGEGALVLSLAAIWGVGGVVGHVAFPRLFVERPGRREPAVGLAPLAVAPAFQRRGIGAVLVHHGLGALAAQGERLVFVLGDPAYYTRFGFAVATASTFASRYAGPHFMALRLAADAPTSGLVSYPDAFDSLK